MTANEERVVSVSRDIKAEPSAIFDLLADPARPCEIDGSATVVSDRGENPDRLSLGATFGMDMKLGPLPYRTSNEVVAFEEDREIAWRHFGHHVWRYRLEPIEGGTRVTESFEVPTTSWISTMNLSVGAGFYSSVWGPLPFAFGPVQPETFLLFRAEESFRVL